MLWKLFCNTGGLTKLFTWSFLREKYFYLVVIYLPDFTNNKNKNVPAYCSNKLDKNRHLEYYPYDKYKSPHTETPISNTGGGGYSEKSKTQSAKICLNFNFRGRGYSEVKYSKCQDLPKFQFLGWGYSGTGFQDGGALENLDKNFTVHKPACASQIVSHILCMWRLKSCYFDWQC